MSNSYRDSSNVVVYVFVFLHLSRSEQCRPIVLQVVLKLLLHLTLRGVALFCNNLNCVWLYYVFTFVFEYMCVDARFRIMLVCKKKGFWVTHWVSGIQGFWFWDRFSSESEFKAGLNSNFGFRCPNTPPNRNPTRYHPLPNPDLLEEYWTHPRNKDDSTRRPRNSYYSPRPCHVLLKGDGGHDRGYIKRRRWPGKLDLASRRGGTQLKWGSS